MTFIQGLCEGRTHLVAWALALPIIGVYSLSETDIGQEALRYFQNRPTITQTVSDNYVSSKGAEVDNDFQYSANDIWYSRKDSLENLARNASAESITPETISDLSAIAERDQNWMVRDLASLMITSYKSKGDFSETKTNQLQK